MDKLLSVKKNPDAYAELLNDHSIKQIEEKLEKVGSYEELARIYRLRYNAVLARYSEKHTETNVIGGLYNLKGAIRYAEQRGNIARRSRYFAGRDIDNGRNVQEVGRNSPTAQKQITTDNRSDKGGFSMPQIGTPRQGELSPAAKAIIALMRNAGLKVETDTAKMQEALSRAMQFAIRAWHGTSHNFKRFSLSGIGTGEGAQAHGWGLYFAGKREVGEDYRDTLSRRLEYNGKTYEFTDYGWIDENGSDDVDPVIAEALNALAYGGGQIEAAVERLNKAIKSFERMAKHDGWSQKIIDETVGDYQKSIDIVKSGKIKTTLKGYLYEVEIPDADVMLDEQKKFAEQPEKVQRALRAIAKELGIEFKGEDTGEWIYSKILVEAEDDKAASELLNKHGVKGITYVGGRDGRCYVVFDDTAIKIINKFDGKNNPVQLLKTSKGEVLGCVADGVVYLDPAAMDETTPIHEYTHVWDNLVKATNPKLWAHGKRLMKELPLWNEVKNDPNYADIKNDEDLLASEVHARLTGEHGAKLLAEMQKDAKTPKGLITALKKWLDKFWQTLKDTFTEWGNKDVAKIKTADDFMSFKIRISVGKRS